MLQASHRSAWSPQTFAEHTQQQSPVSFPACARPVAARSMEAAFRALLPGASFTGSLKLGKRKAAEEQAELKLGKREAAGEHAELKLGKRKAAGEHAEAHGKRRRASDLERSIPAASTPEEVRHRGGCSLTCRQALTRRLQAAALLRKQHRIRVQGEDVCAPLRVRATSCAARADSL